MPEKGYIHFEEIPSDIISELDQAIDSIEEAASNVDSLTCFAANVVSYSSSSELQEQLH